MKDEDKKKKPDHRSIPDPTESPELGTGMAEWARQLFLKRRKKVEEEVERIKRGG